MDGDKDFAADRLVPFCIGLAVSFGLGIVGGALYGLADLMFAVGSYGADYGNTAGVIIAFVIGVPLVLAGAALGIAFWLLITWLLGRWAQEKCRNYTVKKAAQRGEENKFRAQVLREAERRMQEQAAWEAEWEAMKRRQAADSAQSGGAPE